MKLETAIQSIHAPKGVTSIIQGVINGDYSVLSEQNALGASIEKIEEQVAFHKKQLDECRSDWAYWAILGDLAYWRAVRNIYKAAELVGAENLPDVAIPDVQRCIVMDAIGKVEKFGEDILKEAQLTPS